MVCVARGCMCKTFRSDTYLLFCVCVCMCAVDLNAKKVETIAGGQASGHMDAAGPSASFAKPTDIVRSADGKRLYIADSHNCRIRRVDPTTKQVSTVAGIKEMVVCVCVRSAILQLQRRRIDWFSPLDLGC